MEGGQPSGQAVAAICPRNGSTGSARGSPRMRGDQTPAASTACSTLVVPAAVTTPVTRPCATWIDSTGSGGRGAPRRRGAARQGRGGGRGGAEERRGGEEGRSRGG